VKSNKAKVEILAGPLVDFSVEKFGEHTVINIKSANFPMPGAGTVGYAALWALLQIDAEAAKGAIPP
jgi:hypothetical protein